ncbi:MAG: hypothetical protein MPN21_20410 [Thermoanaerobaculia bacterium]|nr:hypothetical protein [Thermoanaerobaculia bacterium]
MSPWDTTGVEDLSLEALKLLGADEVEIEISATYAPIFIEAADRTEVIPVDTRDPAGGFGSVDLWLATVVPVLAAAQGLRRDGHLSSSALVRVIDGLVGQVNSPRARRQSDDLKRVVHLVLGMQRSN